MLAARIGGDHTWYSRGQKAGVAPRPCAPGRRPRQRPGRAASRSNSASKPLGRFDELGEDKELAWSCGKAVQSACRCRWGPSPGPAPRHNRGLDQQWNKTSLCVAGSL